MYLGRALCAYSCSVALLEASSISVASGFGQKYQHLSTHVCCVAVPTQRCAGEVALLSTGKQEMIREQTNQLVSAVQRESAGNAEGRFAAQASPAGWVETG